MCARRRTAAGIHNSIERRWRRTWRAPGLRTPIWAKSWAGGGERRKLRVTYRDEKEQETVRVLRPLGLYFWGAVWTLAAWCETSRDFRNFRLDRISVSEVLEETFELEAGKGLDDFLKAMRARKA